MPSVRDRILKAKAANAGNNIKPGKGVVIVRKIICEQMNEGATFVAEFLVESAESYTGTGPDGKPYEPADPAGFSVSWVQKLDKHKSAEGQVKAFILALMDEKEQDVSPNDFAVAFALFVDKEKLDPKTLESRGKVQGEPAEGIRLNYETIRKEVRSSKGKWIDPAKFTPYTDALKPELIADGKAKLAEAGRKAEAAPAA